MLEMCCWDGGAQSFGVLLHVPRPSPNMGILMGWLVPFQGCWAALGVLWEAAPDCKNIQPEKLGQLCLLHLVCAVIAGRAKLLVKIFWSF